MEIKIRSATLDDAEELLKIYSYYVEKTAISFEWETPTLEIFQKRIERALKKYPYLVAECEGKIIGYAYAHEFILRDAYKYSAELTIYLDKNFRRNGVGRKLYETLEKNLREMGILNLYACIGSVEVEDEFLNHDSEIFHERMGFDFVGRFKNCGYKFNRWYDMIYMEKIIGEHL